MVTAKAFRMKVSRYFVGFGPTLWSFKRGETEYGVKPIPLGGFVKIVGMTPQDDDVAPEDEPRAMWRFPVWKRTIVMAAGSVTHFILGFVILWLLLVAVGVTNPALTGDQNKLPPYITVQQCVPQSADATACAGSVADLAAPAAPPIPARACTSRDWMKRRSELSLRAAPARRGSAQGKSRAMRWARRSTSPASAAAKPTLAVWASAPF